MFKGFFPSNFSLNGISRSGQLNVVSLMTMKCPLKLGGKKQSWFVSQACFCNVAASKLFSLSSNDIIMPTFPGYK